MSLSMKDLTAGYGEIVVVRDLSFEVPAGSVTVMVGQNGAGKTTTLRTIAGLIHARSGTVALDGVDLGRMPTHRRVRTGITLVPEGRGLAMQLSAADNLELASRHGDPLAEATALFPELGRLLGRRAGLLSGGEQQMLALARAMLTRPRILLVDELSLGLAPVVVDRLVTAVRDLAATGVGVLVVEQHVHIARALADQVVVLRRGELIYSGTSAALDADEAKLGLGDDLPGGRPVPSDPTEGLPMALTGPIEPEAGLELPLDPDPRRDLDPEVRPT